jgi:O-acetyl-ADP-ribose deacetylase (regulator of RNase III)
VIEVIVADITTLDADAIVNGASRSLSAAGVDGALRALRALPRST